MAFNESIKNCKALA
jgi:hypothetical protein